jgi:hypothetical protein
MRQFGKTLIVGAIALAAACSATAPAWAGYMWGGDGMGVVATGTIPNGAVSLQSVGPWPQSTTVSGGYSTQFTTPACDDVVASRLVLGIYGGSASNMATVTITVNGVPTVVTIGGGTNGTKADPNPEFTTGQTNVYGSTSSGAWVVSVPVAADLNTNGVANSVNISATTSSNFDGRLVYASLWDVYQKSSLNNTFQYAVAEGSGDIYTTTPGTAQSPTVASRRVEMGGFNTSNLQSAQLDTLYTYVHSGQDNALFINSNNASNGTLLGHPAVSYDGVQSYDPVQASFPVTSVLSSSDNWIKFSVDPADGVTGSGTTVFRPQVAILEATSATPEPGTLALLTAGGLTLLVWGRKRMNHKSSVAAASPFAGSTT